MTDGVVIKVVKRIYIYLDFNLIYMHFSRDNYTFVTYVCNRCYCFHDVFKKFSF